MKLVAIEIAVSIPVKTKKYMFEMIIKMTLTAILLKTHLAPKGWN